MVKVIWRKGALDHLNKNYNHIKKDSLQSANKVRDTIFDMAEALKDQPTIYPLDKYRKNNKGDIRAFEKFSLRVAYQVTKTEIRIIRVRHTSRDPLDY
ncbi:hypothetical protein ATO12_11005 [Aquimarina atlantica]|jgi:plasmid stabilization system protein ParE|uniref:Plasmid stabilization protein n=1 Tax=Aquimarina atlantica TaxID=1317122 RepID=A0A023BNK1_9FLAO|nr:type II toxin-antitoxin system RelE/ParE family toxin [Aquimarina atlantica]EZH71283.1 hypothetical protein ATO12_11005 [Aquimarina atlantica]